MGRRSQRTNIKSGIQGRGLRSLGTIILMKVTLTFAAKEWPYCGSRITEIFKGLIWEK